MNLTPYLVVCLFVLIFLAIQLSVRPGITASDSSFDIFKLSSFPYSFFFFNLASPVTQFATIKSPIDVVSNTIQLSPNCNSF